MQRECFPRSRGSLAAPAAGITSNFVCIFYCHEAYVYLLYCVLFSYAVGGVISEEAFVQIIMRTDAYAFARRAAGAAVSLCACVRVCANVRALQYTGRYWVGCSYDLVSPAL